MATVPAMGARRFPASFPVTRTLLYIRTMRRRAAALGLLIVLSGCFTGKRPSVSTEPFAVGSSSGDPAIDQVLHELDMNNVGPYTADYTMLTKFGNVSRPGSVSVDHGRRSITVGNVRFLTVNNVSQTCPVDNSRPCSPSLDPASISDTQITPDFYGPDAAKRLRRDATALVGPAVLHVETIAGQSTTCVDVPLPGGTSVFCVLAGGPLARLDDASIEIFLTQFAPAVDESLFATT